MDIPEIKVPIINEQENSRYIASLEKIKKRARNAGIGIGSLLASPAIYGIARILGGYSPGDYAILVASLPAAVIGGGIAMMVGYDMQSEDKKVRKILEHLQHQMYLPSPTDYSLEEMAQSIDKIRNPALRQFTAFQLLLQQGRIDEAFQAMDNHARLKERFKRHEAKFVREMASIEKPLFYLANFMRRKDIFYHIFLAQLNYETNKKKRARRIIEKGIRRFDEQALELDILGGNLAELYQDEETSIRRYQDAINLIENSPSFKNSFSRLGEQRNESMSIKSKLVDGALYVKRGKDLKKEFKVNKMVYTTLEKYAEERGFGAEFICVARSLGFLESFNGFDYHFTRRKGNGNLEDLIMREPETADEAIRKAIESLVKISALTSDSSLGEYDYESEFERRVVGRTDERVGTNDYLSRLKERWFGLLRSAAVARREQLVFSHCDAGPTNMLPDGTVIDFEFAGTADPTFDSVSVKERSLREFTGEDMKHMVEIYRRHGMESLKDIERLAVINKAHTAMTEYGTAIHRRKDERARMLLDRSVRYLEMIQRGLGGLFKDYATHSASFATIS